MLINKPKLLCVLLCTPVASSLAATGVNTSPNTLKIGLQALTEVSDNATKQEVDKISERQDKYDLGVAGNYSNDWLLFVSNYDAYRQVYDKASQPDYNYLEGLSKLTLGNPYEAASLLVTQSSRSLLSAPDAIDVTSNRDQRNILTLEPTLRLRMSPADLLTIKGDFMTASFRRDSAKKAESQGAELGWVRSISKIDEFQLRAKASKITFENFTAANYEYQNLTASYAAKLNHFSYQVQIGQNRAKPETATEAFSRPFYSVESSYSTIINTFKLIASQTITNSSTGDGNAVGLGDPSYASKGTGVDLLNQRTTELSWLNTGLCELCTVSLSATHRSDDYRVLLEDGVEKSVGAGFGYKVWRNASLDFRLSKHQKDFPSGSTFKSYSADRGHISFSYHFQNQAELKLFVEKEKRDSSAVLAQRYDEQKIGVSLSCHF